MSDDNRRRPEWFEETDELTEDDMQRAARAFWVLIAAVAAILTLGIWGIYEAIT